MNTIFPSDLRAAFVSGVLERMIAIGYGCVRLGPNQMFVARTFNSHKIFDMVQNAHRFRITKSLSVIITIIEDSPGTIRGIDTEILLASWELMDPECTVENVTNKLVEIIDGHSA